MQSGKFYLKTKEKSEAFLNSGFGSVSVLQPSLLLGNRTVNLGQVKNRLWLSRLYFLED
jgi:hypothetical protein